MRHPGIELGRVVAFFFIVVIHVNAFGFWGAAELAGFLTDEAARFAVPLFFLISGYFWKQKLFSSLRHELASLAWRLWIPMIFWVVIYFTVEYSEILYDRTYYRSAVANVLVPLHGGPGMHLWFLPALFIGTVLCAFGIRLLGLLITLYISIVLLLCGVILGTYIQIYNYELQNIFYRNGLFFAPFYLSSGYFIAQHQILIRFRWAFIMVLTGFLIHAAEGYFITNRYPMGHDFSIGTVSFAIGAFFLFARLYVKPNVVSDLGSLTLGAYLVHLLVLKSAASSIVDRGPFTAIAVAVGAALMSLAIAALFKRVPMLRHVV